MRTLAILTIPLIIGLIYVNSNAATNSDLKPKSISAEEMHKMVEDKANFTIIDARYEKHYKLEHIPGAINIPADKVNAETLAAVAPDMNAKLAFYCTDVDCTASRIGAAKAIGAGYKYVYEFLGGIKEWKEHNFPVTTAAAITPAPATAPAN